MLVFSWSEVIGEFYQQGLGKKKDAFRVGISNYIHRKLLDVIFIHAPNFNYGLVKAQFNMMTSSNGNIFRVTSPLCSEFSGHRLIPLPKASDAELWCFLSSGPE